MAPMAIHDEMEFTCPCCGATVIVDTSNAKVVRHAARSDVPKEKKLDVAFEKLAEETKKLESKFDSAISSQKRHKDALERAFDKAHEQVKKEVEEKGEVERPPSIFDRD
jgi:hypothetical protein